MNKFTWEKNDVTIKKPKNNSVPKKTRKEKKNGKGKK